MERPQLTLLERTSSANVGCRFRPTAAKNTDQTLRPHVGPLAFIS